MIIKLEVNKRMLVVLLLLPIVMKRGGKLTYTLDECFTGWGCEGVASAAATPSHSNERRRNKIVVYGSE